VITIRRAEPGDAAALVALTASVTAEPGNWLLQSGAPGDVGHERRYLRAVRRSVDAAVFVAEDAGAIIGRLSLARDPHPASAHVADLGLMVVESRRREGIGRRLLEHALLWADASGVAKLELHVFPWNTAAIALYEGFGFVPEGYRVGHYLRAGEEVDAILMALRLSR
jgi:RimJ/RimL family protein N-acetyltransferase